MSEIRTATVPCKVCAGKGFHLRAHGPDLRQWREDHGVVLSDLAKVIINPNTGKPVAISYLSNVERSLPGYPCVEWLYREYLRIPEMLAEAEKEATRGAA